MQNFRREREYKVVIKFAAKASLHHLGQFLAGKRADGPKEALQILDIVLRELSMKRYNELLYCQTEVLLDKHTQMNGLMISKL